MSALPFAVPHLDAIGRLPQGLLYPHQADGVVFLMSKGRAILADDMGLGKTRQAIVAMQIAAPEGAILVVCPASLKLNWRREIRLVDPEASIEVIGGRADRPEDGVRRAGLSSTTICSRPMQTGFIRLTGRA